MTFKNSNKNVIYKTVTDTNDSSYLYTLDQIYDIVGEEDWIHGESNCLVNLASGRTFMLLGSKEEGMQRAKKSII